MDLEKRGNKFMNHILTSSLDAGKRKVEYKNYRKPSSNPGTGSHYWTEWVSNLRLLDNTTNPFIEQTHDLGGGAKKEI